MELKDALHVEESKIITIGENEYIIGALKLIDYIKFQMHVTDKIKAQTVKLYKLSGDPIDFVAIRAITVTQKDFDAEMNTLEGLFFLFTEILKRNQKLDSDEIHYIQNNLDIDNIEQITELISDAFDTVDAEVVEAKNPKPKARKKAVKTTQ